ncbi:MAG: glycosyltransferase [Nitrospiraceae bacterium]|nr:MAG: glycosyltransferase [Nitrospiraceae bacterium]
MEQNKNKIEPGMGRTIVVAIPCYNEELTIVKVIRGFRNILPEAPIHVFDNNSSDKSAEMAQKEGAIIHYVRKQGKGNVMQAIFDAIDADALIVVDGDDTYYAEDAPRLLDPILKGKADMVVGNRLVNVTDYSMRRLHQFGNRLIVGAINFMFKVDYLDILSGYRVFSRRFIRTVPILTPGFETETELTLQALEKGMEVIELPISYKSRPEGSESKLRSFYDGRRIIMTAAMLLRDHHPIRLFGVISLVGFIGSAAAALMRIINYLGVATLPDKLLTGIIIILSPLSVVSLAIGLILSAINTRFRELNQISSRGKFND